MIDRRTTETYDIAKVNSQFGKDAVEAYFNSVFCQI